MSDTLIPLTALYSSDTKRKLVDFVCHEADAEESYRLQAVADEVGTSREAVRVAAYAAENNEHCQAFGIIDVVEKGITKQLQRADTESVETLRAYDAYPLDELLDSGGKRRLVEFFLADADPEARYVYADIQRGANVQYETVDSNLSTLIEAGLVRELDVDGKTHYAVDAAAPIREALIEINEALYATYTDRNKTPITS